MPELEVLKPQDVKIIREYVKNGGNGRQAVLTAAPEKSVRAADVKATRLVNSEHGKRAIIATMEQMGVTDELVSKRIKDQLVSTDPWTVNEGIKHSRAIKGLDAERKSHLTVDKRSVNIELNAEEARDLFQSLLSSAKSKRGKG